MVGVYRGAVSTADPCDELWQAYQRLKQQTDADIATIRRNIEGLHEEIGKREAEAGGIRARIDSIVRELAAEPERREYWSKMQQRFSEAASTATAASRHDAGEMSQLCAAQIKKSDEHTATLKGREQVENDNLDNVENHWLPKLRADLAHQEDLLKQANDRLEMAMRAWVDCKIPPPP